MPAKHCDNGRANSSGHQLLRGLGTLAHRLLWQRLPYALRRAALFRATAWVAPRPTLEAAASLPVLVAGAFSTASGLGHSARLCHDALKAVGLPLFGIDLTAGLMQPNNLDPVFEDGRHVEGAGTIILHVNAPLVPLAMLLMGSKLVRQKRIVGYWAWELPRAPAEWRHGASFVHEIWVPSEFAARAVVPVVADRPVRVVPHPVGIGLASRAGRRSLPRQHFTVLSIFDMGSSFARKNPLAVIEAFREAFGSDAMARLVLKCSNPSAYPEGLRLMKIAIGDAANITVVAHTMTAEELDGLYAEADVYISLHRSEGFGLTIAEAMLRGLPVVATSWSGNLDLLTPETGVPIRYRLEQARDPQGTYHHPDMLWAAADVGQAADALRRLRTDAALREGLGRRAVEFAANALSGDAYARSVLTYLGLCRGIDPRNRYYDQGAAELDL